MILADPNSIRMFENVKSVAGAALFLLLLVGCNAQVNPENTVGFEGGIMGTTYRVSVVGTLDEVAVSAAADAIEGVLQRIDGRMSTYKPDSEISKLNAHVAGESVKLSEETFEVIALAQEVNVKSSGAFDITVGPLVNAWGFGPDELEVAPSDEELQALMALTGPDKITLDSATTSVSKSADDVYCDLSAIAKGYAVDQVATALTALGYKNYMVEVGGEVRTAGVNGRGLPWRIAIEKPVDGERVVEEIVGLTDVSLATSGNYRNFYMADGKRISHTINPRTGRPVEHSLASVSVIHPACALADAYATALMVLGPEEGMAIAEAQGLAVFFIIHGDGDSFVTKQTASFAPYRMAH